MSKNYILQATGGRPSSFTEDSNGDLFAYSANAGYDPMTAKGAFSEIWRRHSKYVKNRFVALLRDKPQYNPDDLLQETFIRAFENAHQYERAKEGTSPEQESRYTRSWLFQIGRNIFLNNLRVDYTFQPIDEIQDILNDATATSTILPEEQISIQLQKEEHAEWNQEKLAFYEKILSEVVGNDLRNREILLATENSTELEKTLGLKANTIRVRKRRLLEKLEEVKKKHASQLEVLRV